MIRQQALLRGIVQGVGFRPFVYREAKQSGLTGWVKNAATGVTLQVQGQQAALELFFQRLRQRSPPQARIDSISIEQCPNEPTEFGFRIVHSDAREHGEHPQLRPNLPADQALCDDCRREIDTPTERRYRYPFTNCTQCGPRSSIVTGLPYDRERTTLEAFSLCTACRREYEDEADRRFHAEPIACPACGPHLALLSAEGKPLAERAEALECAAQRLRAGEILALLGVGGFQLLVDATRQAAVQRLRQRKAREAKPLAVMFRDAFELAHHAQLNPQALALLQSAPAPIVLLPRKATSTLASAVAPGADEIGALLPYTPLHHLLLKLVPVPVVCTSGNLSNEPMSIEFGAAVQDLAGIPDAWLTHNRPIARAMDDSVARVGRHGPELVRRARGYAPGSVARLPGAPTTLALGAHYKNTVALVQDGELVVSQHLGDLDSDRSIMAQHGAVDDLLRFFEAEPSVLACDLHPGYASTRLAETLGERLGLEPTRIQHHHAHIAAVQAEYALDGPLLGLAWDGTGLGTDGTLWGSEALSCQGAEAKRVGYLESFPLPGGERAQREPRRCMLGLLHALGLEADAASHWFAQHELPIFSQMLEAKVNCPLSNSVGRLFDAVAALLGVRGSCSFEGQAAMELETLARKAPVSVGAYPLAHEGGATLLTPLCEALLADQQRGVERATMARRFHAALIDWGVSLARHTALGDVILSGGCFQNRLLADGLEQHLEQAGFRVWRPRALPPNDGQIAAGQAWLAALRAHGGVQQERTACA